MSNIGKGQGKCESKKKNLPHARYNKMVQIRAREEWRMIWREGQVINHVGACQGTQNTGLRTMRLY